jgi:hypothetical protein
VAAGEKEGSAGGGCDGGCGSEALLAKGELDVPLTPDLSCTRYQYYGVKSCIRITYLVQTCDQLCTYCQRQLDQHDGYHHQTHEEYGRQRGLSISVSI